MLVLEYVVSVVMNPNSPWSIRDCCSSEGWQLLKIKFKLKKTTANSNMFLNSFDLSIFY